MHFSDYLYIFYKWKRFIIINVVIFTVIGGIVSFLIPNQYKAAVTVFYTQPNALSLGGLGGGSLPKGVSSLGAAKLFGGGSTASTEDMLLAILNRRETMRYLLDKYKLLPYYGVTDGNYDKAIRAFTNDLSFGPDDHSMLEISVINEDPKLSAEIANFLISYLDSTNIELNISQARNNREFVERRYEKSLADLKIAQDSLFDFEQEYGVFVLPTQFEVAVKMTAELESKLMEQELKILNLKITMGETSPIYQHALLETENLKRRVHEIKNADVLSDPSNVLIPFKNAPFIAMSYMKLVREIEIQTKLLGTIMPLYEQSRIEEQKSVPTILPLDKATVPQLKYSPKRSFIILGFFFIAMFFHLFFAVSGEIAIKRVELQNPLQAKMQLFYKRVARKYKMDIA